MHRAAHAAAMRRSRQKRRQQQAGRPPTDWPAACHTQQRTRSAHRALASRENHCRPTVRLCERYTGQGCKAGLCVSSSAHIRWPARSLCAQCAHLEGGRCCCCCYCCSRNVRCAATAAGGFRVHSRHASPTDAAGSRAFVATLASRSVSMQAIRFCARPIRRRRRRRRRAEIRPLERPESRAPH